MKCENVRVAKKKEKESSQDKYCQKQVTCQEQKKGSKRGEKSVLEWKYEDRTEEAAKEE